MTEDPVAARVRVEALARSTTSALAEAETDWPRKAKTRAKKAPSEAARTVFELAAALPASDRTWLRVQLG